jgi:hypothetical protein
MSDSITVADSAGVALVVAQTGQVKGGVIFLGDGMMVSASYTYSGGSLSQIDLLGTSAEGDSVIVVVDVSDEPLLVGELEAPISEASAKSAECVGHLLNAVRKGVATLGYAGVAYLSWQSGSALLRAGTKLRTIIRGELVTIEVGLAVTQGGGSGLRLLGGLLIGDGGVDAALATWGYARAYRDCN